MKKHFTPSLLVAFFLCVFSSLFSQNIGINTSGTNPSINAILDLNTGNNFNLGLIIPHVTLGASLNTFSPPIANAMTAQDTGMMVYNTGGAQPAGYYCWSGSSWVNVSAGALANAWDISGNTGTTPGVNYAGTADAKDFVIKTSGSERMRFLAGGTAGIGTPTPQSTVDVNGSMSLGTYAGVIAAPANGMIISGNVGIAATLPAQALEVGGTANTIRVDGLQSGNTFNIANGSAPLTTYMMFANTNGDLNAMAAGAVGNSLIWTATGPMWANPVTSATAWQILGNSNIVDGTNFIGTTNTVPINFQINGNTAGRIDMNKFNTFLGYQTTPITTTGQNNTSIGYQALQVNTSASFNTAVGAGALKTNNAANNTAVGYQALKASTNTGNTAIGYEPLLNATSGTYNFAGGYLPMGNGIVTGTGNTAIGYEPLYNNTSGGYNSAIGYLPMGNGTNTGFYNSAIGYQALYNNTSGQANIALGYSSLFNNSSGGYNTALGYRPMSGGINTGYYNNAIGYYTLYNNSSGYYNSAMGYYALYGNTSGWYNSAMGYYALYNNSSGYYNNAIGYQALYSNGTSSGNNAIGYYASEASNGSYNNAIGYYAQYDNYGSAGYNNAMGYFAGAYNNGYYYNNYMGYEAGYQNYGGTANNAIGYYSQELSYAGYNNSMGYYALYGGAYGGQYGTGNNALGYFSMYNSYNGSYNNALGGYALYANYSGSYNNAIGYGAMYGVGGTTSAYYNNAMGYYAMDAITTGYYNNAMGYYALYSNTTGYHNNAIGFKTLYSNTTGGGNVAVGDSALYSNTSGYYNTALGYHATVSSGTLTNATAIGNGAVASSSNTMVFGNNNVTQHEFNGALMPYYGAAYQAGTTGQVLTSQGPGVAPQWTAGSSVTGANNGLTLNSGNVQLGGPLIQNTSVTASSSNYNMNYDLGTGLVAGTGAFSISNGGPSNTYLTVQNTGNPGNPGQIGIGTVVPNTSAALDITSVTGGLLFPRLDSAHIAAIATPANGLVLFNTTSNCLQLFAGAWVNIVCGCTPLAAPGAISGASQYCASALGQPYTCGAVVGAVSYVWSIAPSIPGTSITGSGTTASANFAATPATYTISVADINGSACQSGYTTFVVTMGSTPAAPAIPSGPVTPVISTVQTYTVTAVPGQTYTWSSSSTNIAVITASGVVGTVATATVTFSATAGTTNICVFTTNNGCNSPSACLSVTSSNCVVVHGTTTFNYITNATQTWTVPACGVTQITVTVKGAQGGSYGSYTGGLGASMQGVLTVTPGEVLTLWVGQQGVASQNAGGGGGGSGVFNGVTPLIVAGAGGGCSIYNNGMPGQITTFGGSSSGAGGAGGLGGQKGYFSGDCGWAGGGAGINGDGYGGDGSWDGGALPGTLSGPAAGKAKVNGGAGGLGGSCGFSALGQGGWGCGGGARAEYGGGGGGGYSGGGGGQYRYANGTQDIGAGGGSYNSGASQVNLPGVQLGNGQIIIQD